MTRFRSHVAVIVEIRRQRSNPGQQIDERDGDFSSTIAVLREAACR
jgi:hypothetical protein